MLIKTHLRQCNCKLSSEPVESEMTPRSNCVARETCITGRVTELAYASVMHRSRRETGGYNQG
jgi:hypothetical protein